MIPKDLGTVDTHYVQGNAAPIGINATAWNTYSDQASIRYQQFAAEARAKGITDPFEIDRYAIAMNQQWGIDHGIPSDFPWYYAFVPLVAYAAVAVGVAALADTGAASAGAAEAGTAEAVAGTELTVIADPVIGAPELISLPIESLPVVDIAPAITTEIAPAVVDIAPAVAEIAPAVVDVAPSVAEIAPAVADIAPTVADAAIADIAPTVADAAAPSLTDLASNVKSVVGTVTTVERFLNPPTKPIQSVNTPSVQVPSSSPNESGEIPVVALLGLLLFKVI